MSTASKAANDAGEATGRARTASPSVDELQQSLRALRDDFRRLAEQVAGVVGQAGTATLGDALADEAFGDARRKAGDVIDAVREVSDHFADAIDHSIKTRPYTTLALVAGVAFVFGAAFRR